MWEGGWQGQLTLLATQKSEKPFEPRDHYPLHTGTQPAAHVRNRFSAYFVPQPAENNTFLKSFTVWQNVLAGISLTNYNV